VPLHVPPMRVQPDPLNLLQADAAAAPTLYGQAHMQAVVNLVNANKAKLNAALAALRAAGVIKE
jgi:hypothetical protein